jgi:hypothetical protein
MATVGAEKDKQPGFDVETFCKLVALFDSSNVGEAENAFRKAVLMCGKKGLRFCDAAGMALGQGDGGEVAELRDQLQQQEAEYAAKLTWSADEIQRLNGEMAAALSGSDGNGEEEHVIDLRGRLRRAWVYPQFRLFALTVVIAVGGAAARPVFSDHEFLGRFWALVCLFVFGKWSVAQFRKRGLGQVFLKSVVYFLTISICDAVGQGFGIHIDEGPMWLVAALLALVLALSRLSEWLGEKVRLNVWESGPMHVLRGWF